MLHHRDPKNPMDSEPGNSRRVRLELLRLAQTDFGKKRARASPSLIAITVTPPLQTAPQRVEDVEIDSLKDRGLTGVNREFPAGPQKPGKGILKKKEGSRRSRVMLWLPLLLGSCFEGRGLRFPRKARLESLVFRGAVALWHEFVGSWQVFGSERACSFESGCDCSFDSGCYGCSSGPFFSSGDGEFRFLGPQWPGDGPSQRSPGFPLGFLGKACHQRCCWFGGARLFRLVGWPHQITRPTSLGPSWPKRCLRFDRFPQPLSRNLGRCRRWRSRWASTSRPRRKRIKIVGTSGFIGA